MPDVGPPHARRPGTAKLRAHGGPWNAQLRSDLAQGPALGAQVGCALNVHRATVMNHRCELLP
jgi:hypothetical protein